jgi:uncharacterized protein (TIGR03435 family)
MIRIVRRHIGLFIALLVFACSSSLRAQSTPITEEPNYKPTLIFDIASVRPAAPPTGDVRVTVSSPPHSSRFATTSLPLKALIQIAYGFDRPIVGVPEWVETTFYDIQARSDDETDARLAKLTDNEVRLEKRHAIRELLATRFALKTHEETRNSAIYNLVVAKGGIKMTITPPPPPSPDGQAPPPPPTADVQAHGNAKGLEFIASNMVMRALCTMLSSQVRAPVADKTGLDGASAYSFTLQMGGDWSQNNPESYPSIFTALQEQLGLKLESVHESVPNLMIDQISKPTAN